MTSSDAGGDTNGKLTYTAHKPHPNLLLHHPFSSHSTTITSQQNVSWLQSAFIEIIFIFHLHSGDSAN
jgi:hypothetical protein